MILTTAAEQRLPSLYHYQPFDPERLKPIIHERLLYLSNPNHFNDPWDCRPFFNLSRLSDPAVIERHVQWYIYVTRKHGPQIPEHEIQRRANILRTNVDFHRERIAECSAAISAQIGNQYRVYCLASRADSELMWAHYGEKHQGICLEFSTQNEVFSQALKVWYAEEYPLLDLTVQSDAEVLLPLLSKSTAWEYEGEYRLVSQEEAKALASDTLISRNGLVQIPSGSLASIIVGCGISQENLLKVQEIIGAAPSPVRLKRAVRVPDRYQLAIEDV
jgi:hypothetical protein